jgi:regulatory protein
MKITSITRYGDKGNRYRVDVDGAYWYILADTIIMDFHLRKGKEVDEALLDEIRQAAEYRKGRERAFYLLERREHAKGELVQKLAQKIDWEMAEKIADEMEELGLIHEDRYARRLVEYLSTVKKHGPRRIRQELMQKGFARDVIEEAMDGIETDEDALVELVRKKYARFLGPEQEDEPPSGFRRGYSKGKNKALQGLMRLGHSFGESLAAIETVEAELREEE